MRNYKAWDWVSPFVQHLSIIPVNKNRIFRRVESWKKKTYDNLGKVSRLPEEKNRENVKFFIVNECFRIFIDEKENCKIE